MSLVQHKLGQNSYTVSSVAATLDSPPVAGNLLVAFVYWHNSAGDPNGVTDSAGNTYEPVGAKVGCSRSIYQGGVRVFVAHNVASASPHTVTATYNGTVLIAYLEVAEFENVDVTASPLDQFDSETTGATPLSAPYDFAFGTVTPTRPNELIVVAGFRTDSGDAVDVAPSGFTEITSTYYFQYYKQQVAAQAESPTISFAGSTSVCGCVLSLQTEKPWVDVRDFVEQEIPSAAFPGGVARVLGDLWTEDVGSPLPTAQARLYNVTDGVSVGESAALASADPAACDFGVTLTPGTKRYRAQVTSDVPATDIFFSSRGVGP